MTTTEANTLSLQAFQVEKQYDLGHGQAPKRAVDGISFRISEGERVGFIGRNGAGKTTLLQMLAGITSPTRGHLEVQGKVTAIFTLGMGLREDLSGLENIYIEGELQGRTREMTREIIDQVVDFAELDDFIGRPVRTYSTGMKARLAFSTIVHIKPEILIVDEALSVGDARFSAKASSKMRELTQMGRILILVSHSMAAVEDMCTRCIWIDSGRIRLDGTPAEVTRAYLQEVRNADEALLALRFRDQVFNDAYFAGWAVQDAQLRNGEGAGVHALVTGDYADFWAKVQVPVGVDFDALLRLERLDGIPVMETSSRFGSSEHDIRAFKVDLGKLVLNFGVYRAELEVRATDGRRAARRSLVFEVVNPRPPAGGRPILVYPTTLAVTKVT